MVQVEVAYLVEKISLDLRVISRHDRVHEVAIIWLGKDIHALATGSAEYDRVACLAKLNAARRHIPVTILLRQMHDDCYSVS